MFKADLNYYVYITTNPRKTVLYAGSCADLVRRINQHRQNKGLKETFAGRYFCYKLLYYETYPERRQVITREREIKSLSREEKWTLIKTQNPFLRFIDI